MKSIALVLLVVAGAAGCATLQAAGVRSTEAMLTTAGFHVEPADTPDKKADLQQPPARALVRQTQDNQALYVYRDPTVCNCRYVGGEPEYQRYQKLRVEQEIAENKARASGPCGIGPGCDYRGGWEGARDYSSSYWP